MKATFNNTGIVLTAVTAIFLSACAKKPPACGDAETLDLAKSMIIKEARNSPGMTKLMSNLSSLDPDGFTEKFMRSSIDISMIRSSEYDSAAKMYACQAMLGRKDVPNSSATDIRYSTQRTEEGDGGWVLALSNYQQYAYALGITARNAWALAKYSDTWSGTYACGGVNGETSGARGPFTLPVSAVIDEGFRIKLERATAGGGFESLAGSVIPETGAVSLFGIGANSPDDKWQASYEGTVSGNTLKASGGITPNGAQARLRDCTVTLQRRVADKTKPESPAAPTASPSPAASTVANILGTWKGELGGDGRMEIKAAATGVDVVLNVSSPSGCGGEFKGMGSLSNNMLTLKNKDDDQVCTITVKFAGSTANIDENNCSYYVRDQLTTPVSAERRSVSSRESEIQRSTAGMFHGRSAS